MTTEINMFSFRQNTVNDEAAVMSSGRPFHGFGAAEANDRSPTEPRSVGQRVSWLEIDDPSRLHETACQQHGSADQTGIKAQSGNEFGRR